MNKSTLAAVLAAAALLSSAHFAYAQCSPGVCRINTEAVNNYSQCNGPSLANSIADAQGFRNLSIHPFSSSSFAMKAAIASAASRSLARPREMVTVPGGPPDDLPV